MNIGICVFSCSRPRLLHETLSSLKANLRAPWDNSVLHEDEFVAGSCHGAAPIFSEFIVTSPPQGLANALYKVYSGRMSGMDYVVHMEDDWRLNGALDVRWACETMAKHGVDQAYLSSKKTVSEIGREPSSKRGHVAFFLREGEERLGHLVPNITPSIVRPDLFAAFGSYSSDMMGKSPMKAWKKWLHSLPREPKLAFLVLEEQPLLTHLGSFWRRMSDGKCKLKGKGWKAKAPSWDDLATGAPTTTSMSGPS